MSAKSHDEAFTVRLTRDEAELLGSLARVRGVSRAELAREYLRNEMKRNTDPEEIKRAHEEYLQRVLATAEEFRKEYPEVIKD